MKPVCIVSSKGAPTRGGLYSKRRVRMSMFRLPTIAMLALLGAVGAMGSASAQTKSPDPAQSEAKPEANGSEMMPGMMGRNMMSSDMNKGMRMMGPMRGHMMKIMFVIADTDGDGAISFEELTAIHKRVFDAVDANNDGKVTPEEMQAFMQDM
ncbi:EF-hand domain-containing protein [Rhizobium beringeri]|uniref:EF-hand domain-containing protein n=1 Tax=Rhizobium beringeri TaxID=3019934 RepID=UPI002E0E7540|nr:EF-hand domain-containing protein [Rhizobium beringeri]WSH84150.1 EF-hand domain-containing protein [Rhizobium beringeri]